MLENFIFCETDFEHRQACTLNNTRLVETTDIDLPEGHFFW